MPSSHARRMNLVALALLITATIAFGAFHFLVIEYYPDLSATGKPQELGWEVWPELVEVVKEADFSDFLRMIAVASFLYGTLLIVLSPLLIGFLRKSRLAWWVIILSSGIATCGFGGMVTLDLLDPAGSSNNGPGVPCILAAFALNFIGLLFIRREITPDLAEGVSP